MTAPAAQRQSRVPASGEAAFRRIVIATDGGASSQYAVHWAREIAKGHRARVWAIHVLQPEAGDGDDARKILQDVEHGLAPRSVETVFGYGVPARQIASLAESVKADVVIVGSRGREGLERIILGSVAETVNATAPCNVLIARTSPPPRHVLAGVDGSPPSIAAAERALSLAQAFGVRATLLHVREKGAPSGFEAAAQALGATGKALLVEEAEGPAPNAIVQRAEKDGADLIVVGSRGLGRIRRMLVGSTSRHVARFAKASVLVVKET